MSSRLPPRPGEVIDRLRPLAFTWNGRPHVGLDGDTIVSALAAAGVRVFSRSFKYHRARGVLTAGYHDPNTTLQVDAEPNVRAGHRLLAPGMEVRAQNAWPSLDWDVKTATRLVGRFLSPGFYYKTFMQPRALWPVYQRALRSFAAGGTVDGRIGDERYDQRHAHPDVVVAGGGPAGMGAALGAADAGASVMLVEEQHALGGHLRWGGVHDLEALAEVRARLLAADGVEVLTDSVVAGRYDHNWLGIVQRNHPGVAERLIEARAKALVVAAGTLERPYVFEGNDLPGVMLSTAVRRLVNLYAVRPGERAVVLTANAAGDAAAADLAEVGVEVEVVDVRAGGDVIRASGRNVVRSVDLAGGKTVEADLLVTAVGWTTPTSLLDMAGNRSVYDRRAARFVPGPLPDDVLVTGGMVGDGTTAHLVEHGHAVGFEAGRRALQTRARWLAAVPAAAPPFGEPPPERPVPELAPDAHPEVYRASTHGFVDFSEDVSSKDLLSAVEEGYDSIELAKRYTTATMGPLQGKLEVANTVAVHAEATGRTVGETGTTTWRPPYVPLTLGALAGRAEEPVRRSPMQEWHERHGAVPLVAGQWIRPEHYGDPLAEVRNVRSRVGIIDVSPLGKLDLRGRDVPELLELVYGNRWRRLPVGGVRYGVMCAEDGVVLDDGVTGRIGERRWLMTTTSGGAGRVWNWLDDWLQSVGRTWEVHMTAVTDGYASINVAGPESRRLLGRVTDIDLSPERFGAMQVRTGIVAGTPECVVWRIGFTGELSYEVHVPSGHGLAVWEALLAAGDDLGVAPFGIEAQRIMRLEKGHFIVGQDTDGLTRGLSVGLDWAFRLDKEDFAGRPELVWQAADGGYARLVALQPERADLVPPEASQIVEGGVAVGRITSSRWSPTLQRSICLAQVPARLATPGTTVTVHLPDGTDTEAYVMEHHAHFDPTGERLRA